MTASNNFITEDTTISGDLTTASGLTVAGVIEGDINAGGEVKILPDAVVKGDISGPEVFVGGRVEGAITSSGKLIIGPSGEVVGDIWVRSLFIEDGGILDGRCTMGSKRKPIAPSAVVYGSSTPTGSTPKPGDEPEYRIPDRTDLRKRLRMNKHRAKVGPPPDVGDPAAAARRQDVNMAAVVKAAVVEQR